MRRLQAATIALLLPVLAACPDQQREPAVDPATEPVVTDPGMTDPAVTTPQMDMPPAGAAMETLQPVGAATATGEVHAVPRDGSTEIWVTVRQGPPNESLGVRVQSGTCESPGPELARISAISTDGTGMGQARTDVGHAPNLIMDGNHIVAVYAPGTEPERDLPMACATVPQAGMGT